MSKIRVKEERDRVAGSRDCTNPLTIPLKGGRSAGNASGAGTPFVGIPFRRERESSWITIRELCGRTQFIPDQK